MALKYRKDRLKTTANQPILGIRVIYLLKKNTNADVYDSISFLISVSLISLSIEIVQMFGYGATDINDLITNTIGAGLGFCIYTVLHRFIPKSWIKEIRVEGSQCYYELLFFWFSSLLIMLTIQVCIFHAFFPAKMSGGEIQEWK